MKIQPAIVSLGEQALLHWMQTGYFDTVDDDGIHVGLAGDGESQGLEHLFGGNGGTPTAETAENNFYRR
ncbi:MAG: hypothetical protein A3I68_01840 [Candidatus Melainabacteria bacterium RIFCSPLOWO2_02_FULL_35_15]|nr:MAG: hypothetical protein A3F80_09525 [Candidatus Melainabacteria bacterium RIFCSPLOWO2_12_FULL_35_11]OGI14296.1 MAG: hypothetical protein A3I68_01840 [Candidatus Melainabacteria bacterium RIFCSPLOWO2_02_FULL_35_15]